MAKSQAKDAQQLAGFFEHLARTDQHWTLESTTGRLLERNRSEALARAKECAASDQLILAVRGTVVLIGLGEQPPLAVLERAFMMEYQFRGESHFASISATSIRNALPKKPFPALLDLCERVAAKASIDYVVKYCIEVAMQLRGRATERDLEVLRRVPDTLTIQRFIDAASGPLRLEGLRFYEQLLDRPNRRNQFDVSAYCYRADETCLPKLWALLDEPGMRGLNSERYAVVDALARLKQPRVKAVILSELNFNNNFTSSLRSLQVLLEGTNDAEAIQQLLELGRTVRKGEFPRADLAQTIAAIGGSATRAYLEELLEGCNDDDRLRVLLQARGISLAEAMTELHEVGVLTDAQFAKLKKFSKSRSNLASKIMETVQSAGALYRFDAEYSGTPVPYDKLILELAELAGPEFAPDAVDSSGPEPGVEELAYTVTFTLGSRRYEFKCGDQSDWYEHEPLVVEVNRALAEAAVEKRFLSVGNDGQYPQYIFVTPAVGAEANRRGLLPVNL